MGSPVVDDDFDEGWDMTARLVDGRWVERSPRRPEVEPQARREATLLPWLAPQLPVAVPVPQIVSQAPLVLRHAYLPGDPCPGTSAAHGRAVGAFLTVLHAVDVEGAVAHGARDAETSYAEAQEIRDRMAADVLPRLPDRLQEAGAALLERLRAPCPDPRPVHGDLGPTHVRVVGDQVTGVIDWGDSGVGDPAIDLSWTVHGATVPFADAVVAAYRPSADLLRRSADLHLVGPWHEVLFGLGTGQDAYVASGLAGAVARLERLGRSSDVS